MSPPPNTTGIEGDNIEGDNPATKMPDDPFGAPFKASSQHTREHPPEKLVMPTSPDFVRSSASHIDTSPGSSFGGQLSPNYAQGGSFVFPIRSVFHGIVPSESSQSISSETTQHGPHRTGPKSTSATSPAWPERRFSVTDLFDEESDAGIQTIVQMLKDNENGEQKKKSASKPGVATFGGGKDRNVSGGGGSRVGGGVWSPTSPRSRKTSREDEIKADAGHTQAMSEKLVLEQRDSDETHVTAVTIHPGSQPGNDDAPSYSYRHFPRENEAEGSSSSHRRKFSSINYKKKTVSPSSSHECPPPPPPHEAQGPAPQLVHPTPHLAEPSHQSNAGDDRAWSRVRAASSLGSKTNLEVDPLGMASLVSDLSNIVRLGEPGSLSSYNGAGGKMTASGGGTGTDMTESYSNGDSVRQQSGKSNKQTSITSKKAQIQRRRSKYNTRQDSVMNFVQQQAHTTNMQDPNAPTPSPVPAGMDKLGAEGTEGEAAEEGVPSLPVTPVEVDVPEPPSSPGLPPISTPQYPPDGENETENAIQPIAGSAEEADDPEGPAVTMRFQHVATKDGHHIVAGREGKLKKCEDEPITTPGAVQGFGVLMVLNENIQTGELTVRQISENSTEILGLSPKYLFQLDCFTLVLSNDQENILRDTLDYLAVNDGESGEKSLEEEGPSVFLLSGFGEPGSDEDGSELGSSGLGSVGSSAGWRRKEWTCWVAAHRPDQKDWNKVDANGEPIPPPELIVLEFELERDIYNPLIHMPEPAAGTSSAGRSDTPSESATHSMTATNTTSFSGGSNTDRTLDSLMSVGSAPRAGTKRPSPPTAVPDNPSEATARHTDPRYDSELSADSSTTLNAQPRQELMGLEGLEMEIPLAKILESTTNHAKPLRALERMRGTAATDPQGRPRAEQRRRGRGARQRVQRQRSGGTGTMDIFAVLGQINDQLGAAPDLETFLKIATGLVQDICRFHRVLIYQFDEAMNGLVVAELVEWGKTTDLYKGLRFPAADIPPQARQLYKINKVRMLYDRSQTTARMVLKNREDLESPLDMTHCYLRAMSPIHLKYLSNMQVRSSMSVSIMAFGQLWGLIACHSYGHHGMRVSFPVRQMLRILSDSISRNIERLSYAERLHTRKLISTIPTRTHPTGYIVSDADDLLQIFQADAGLLVIGDGCKLLGQNEQGQAMLAIAEYFRIMRFDAIKASSCLRADFPDLNIPRAPETIAGLLYVPLTAKAGQDFIIFLRNGQVREVQWAGKPFKDDRAGQEASLEPRKSFKTWTQTVTGTSRPWTDDQFESAGVLALIYGKFIHVWREKQTAMASNQLTAILLSNTSHAVRTPLSQIINTLELALSGDIDGDTRKMLENSHQASRALLFHVHDLLDLTRIETGNETAFNDPFDIRETITDAVRLYQNELARREIDFQVKTAEDMPKFLIGDSRKIKTVVSNLVANSVKFTQSGRVEVFCGALPEAQEKASSSSQGGYSMSSRDHNSISIQIMIEDTGCGIPNNKLEEMFVTLEGAEESLQKNTGVGLGLAVVARIVEQLGGQLRAESEVDVGTKFFFTVPMMIHYPGQPLSRSTSGFVSAKKSLPGRRSSSDSNSVVSLISSRSAVPEIEFFVNDLQGSHMSASESSTNARLQEAAHRMNRPGTFPVADSSWPVRPTKMEADDRSVASERTRSPELKPEPKATSRFTTGELHSSLRPSDQESVIPQPLTQITAEKAPSSAPRPKSSSVHLSLPDRPVKPTRSKSGRDGKVRMRVMVVEDDMVNSQILQKRLKMDNHTVVAVTNGQEAVDFLKADLDIDAVLMDIQMPIMDGRTASKEIRKLEAVTTRAPDIAPYLVDGRIPIFAVSASLYESDRISLAEDFDGWLLKPLDFARVRTLFGALQDPSKRSAEVYQQGRWERGGYLRDAQSPNPSPSPK